MLMLCNDSHADAAMHAGAVCAADADASANADHDAVSHVANMYN